MASISMIVVTLAILFCSAASSDTTTGVDCQGKCSKLFPGSIPKSDEWFACYRGCRLAILVDKTDEKTKEKITNSCTQVCSEVYSKTEGLINACRKGCTRKEDNKGKQSNKNNFKSPMESNKESKNSKIPPKKVELFRSEQESLPPIPQFLSLFPATPVEKGKDSEMNKQSPLPKDPFQMVFKVFKETLPNAIRISSKSIVTYFSDEDSVTDSGVQKDLPTQKKEEESPDVSDELSEDDIKVLESLKFPDKFANPIPRVSPLETLVAVFRNESFWSDKENTSLDLLFFTFISTLVIFAIIWVCVFAYAANRKRYQNYLPVNTDDDDGKDDHTNLLDDLDEDDDDRALLTACEVILGEKPPSYEESQGREKGRRATGLFVSFEDNREETGLLA